MAAEGLGEVEELAAVELLIEASPLGTTMGQKLHCCEPVCQYRSNINLRYPACSRFEKHVAAASSL
jgi:hypothetical protein